MKRLYIDNNCETKILLTTDASNTSIGAVTEQVNSQCKPITFFWVKLSSTQLSIDLVVYTDHKIQINIDPEKLDTLTISHNSWHIYVIKDNTVMDTLLSVDNNTLTKEILNYNLVTKKQKSDSKSTTNRTSHTTT